MKKIKLFLLIALIFTFAVPAISADKIETLAFLWDQESRELLEKWEMHWGDASGSYVKLTDLAYNGEDQSNFEGSIEATVLGDPGSTVVKYFVLAACGTTAEGYKCSEWSNEVSYAFEIPEDLPPPYEYKAPINFRIKIIEPPPEPTSSNPILMLHGLFGNPSNLYPVRSYLVANGFETDSIFIPSMSANTSMCSLQHLDQIAAAIADIKASTGAEKVDLLGYSRGGTATMGFMRFRNEGDDVGRVVTIAGANNYNCNSVYGTPPADQTPGDVPYTSIWSPSDSTVSQAWSNMEGADNVSIAGVGHTSFPSNRNVQIAVLEALSK